MAMTRGRMGFLRGLTFLVGFAGVAGLVPADEDRRLTAPADDNEIASLIRDLGDPSYPKRESATRRLCAMGEQARRMLEAAAKSDDAETVLRANRILNLLAGQWFAGADVSLALSKTTIAWGEPVDLRVTVTNRSDYPMRIPFEINQTNRAELSATAAQVGDMLDVADFLHVRSDDGREIDLRIDDISADPAVTAAVQQRLNGGPVTMIEPRGKATIILRAFNSGWARYPLLDAGAYTATLTYVPQWDDEVLAAAQVGRVISNAATLTVASGAPEAVSRCGMIAEVVLSRDQADLVAQLINKTDQIMLVNRCFGSDVPFAEGRWVFVLEDQVVEIPVIPNPGASWADFDPAMLVEVRPGDGVELARMGATRLRDRLTDAGADLSGDRWRVYFGYSNMCDRSWQVRRGTALIGNDEAPSIFRKPLSRLILSARYNSNRFGASSMR